MYLVYENLMKIGKNALWKRSNARNLKNKFLGGILCLYNITKYKKQYTLAILPFYLEKKNIIYSNFISMPYVTKHSFN